MNKCSDDDRHQVLSCSLPDCPKLLGEWIDQSECISTGDDETCGPGQQRQTRVCVSGTRDKCNVSEEEQLIECRLPDCPKILGPWNDDGPCNAIGNDKTCGPGNQKQSRSCRNGTHDKCTVLDELQTIPCSLPDCPKELGHWVNDGPCQAVEIATSCGVGRLKQFRNCTDGTTDLCEYEDMKRTVSCSLPNCFKSLGDWMSEGECKSIGSDETCGPAEQKQNRTCISGVTTECSDADKEQFISCDLPDCPKKLGDWTNYGKCEAIGDDKMCGPGYQNQIRSCIDGTKDKCTETETQKDVLCRLPDCPKKLGRWRNEGLCQAVASNKMCGPAMQRQTRTCLNGTTDMCDTADVRHVIPCSLPNCPKTLGIWVDQGNCNAIGANKHCGPGNIVQVRQCEDGTIEKCTREDREQISRCNLADCPMQTGNWTNNGYCVANNDPKECGPGQQKQTRTCVDGTKEKCTNKNRERHISCNLMDCPKEYGEWTNEGSCIADSIRKDCGEGQQSQTRLCTDGTKDKCTLEERGRTIACHLPDCSKNFDRWTNDGVCVGHGANKTCGPGYQAQIRPCINGTVDKCTQEDIVRNISCNLRDCEKKTGAWKNEGYCEAIGGDSSCGPGNQKQIRACIDGTSDKCMKHDREQITHCNLPDCPKVFEIWNNVGYCEADGADKSCGPGKQNQGRVCRDGTIDKCTINDREQIISCNLKNCVKKLGHWINDGVCQASNGIANCGPGLQKQTRSCVDGTVDKCSANDTEQTISCEDAGSSLSPCPGINYVINIFVILYIVIKED